MARFAPDILIEEISVQPERVVAQHLKEQLDDGWLILHSYPWLRPNRDESDYHLREGETDFILLHRNHGLLVLEVKGGPVEYEASSMSWKRHGKILKNPFKQARDNMHALWKQIKNLSFPNIGEEGFVCPIGYAVVFPGCNPAGPPPPDADPAITIGYSDLPQLRDRIENALGHWARRDLEGEVQGVPIEQSTMKGIKEGIFPTFKLLHVLASRVDQDREALIRLTDQQAQVLGGLYVNERVLVEGAAGSGKTILAMSRAQSFAASGKRTLFVCYNKNLAAELRGKVDDENLTIQHFHSLCSTTCQKAGIPFPVPLPDRPQAEREDFWGIRAPDLMTNAIMKVEKFDAIVVDEAQDFKEMWWLPLEEILEGGDDGLLYIFFDRYQNLFGGSLSFPETQTKFKLTANCRNTQTIAGSCKKILESEFEEVGITFFDQAPVGSQPRIVLWDQSKGGDHPSKAIVRKWLSGGGSLRPSQVAIIGPRTLRHSSLGQAGLQGLGGTTDLDRWKDDEGILYATIRTFKGLEADAIVIIDVDDLDDQFMTLADLYVACSRACHEMAVVSSSERVLRILEEGKA